MISLFAAELDEPKIGLAWPIFVHGIDDSYCNRIVNQYRQHTKKYFLKKKNWGWGEPSLWKEKKFITHKEMLKRRGEKHSLEGKEVLQTAAYKTFKRTSSCEAQISP